MQSAEGGRRHRYVRHHARQLAVAAGIALLLLRTKQADTEARRLRNSPLFSRRLIIERGTGNDTVAIKRKKKEEREKGRTRQRALAPLREGGRGRGDDFVIAV